MSEKEINQTENESLNKLRAKFDLKEMELNSLLEITQAINSNMSEESLYKIYGFTLRANLNISKLALYVLDEKWNCKAHFGTKLNYNNVEFTSTFNDINEITPIIDIKEVDVFSEFDLVIPVAHKQKKLAFIFIGDSDVRPSSNANELNTNFIQAISNIIIVAIENKKLVRKQLEQEMIRRELEIAGNLQKFLFPKELPYTSELKVSAFYQPHHSIGGDYYDYLQINDHQFLICIADVSGKGIPAAMLMSNFQASLRTLVRKSTLLHDIINDLNFQIISNAQGQHFITFFVAIYDMQAKRLKYVNSGHNPPYLILPNGSINQLKTGSTILGAFDELPFLNVGIEEGLSSFKLVSYTDGLTELTNKDDEEFGEDRLQEIIEQNKAFDINRMKDIIIESMNTFKGNWDYKDDVTLLLCEVN